MTIRTPVLFVASALYRSEIGRYFFRHELLSKLNLRFEVLAPSMSEPSLETRERHTQSIAGIERADFVLVILDQPVLDDEVLVHTSEALRRGKTVIGYKTGCWPTPCSGHAERFAEVRLGIEKSGGVVTASVEELYQALRKASGSFYA